MTKATLVILLTALLCHDFQGRAEAGAGTDSTGNSGCEVKEIGEILFKKTVNNNDTSRKLNMFLLPYIAYSPTKGFQLGAGGTVAWYQGKSLITRQSAASGTAEFTSKDQKLFALRSNVYSDRNRWFLQGDWRLYIYSLPTYGLGSGRGDAVPAVPGFDADTVAPAGWDQDFLVKFKWFKVHEIFSYRLANDLYAGLGFHLDIHYDIEDTQLAPDSSPR